MEDVQRKSKVSQVVRHNDRRIDELEAAMIDNLKIIDIPVRHYFTKGMYIREVTCPSGSLITTKTHKTQHPFTVSKGKCLVSIDGGVWTEICAPFTGITQPGTRRVVLVVEDCVWTTYHHYKTITGNEGALTHHEQEGIVDKIEERIITKHINKLISGRKELWHG